MMINNPVTLTGIVLKAVPIGETDRRIVLLTKERGRIPAFVRGARKQNSPMVAASMPFSFGKITLYEGRDSYTVSSMEISNYFEEITTNLENSCYGAYFAELAEYYSHEGLEAGEMLKLLYVSFLALEKGRIPKALIRAVYELKLMTINGEYSDVPIHEADDTTSYTWKYVIGARPEELFTFTLKEDRIGPFSKAVSDLMDYYIGRQFKSLEILNTLL